MRKTNLHLKKARHQPYLIYESLDEMPEEFLINFLIFWNWNLRQFSLQDIGEKLYVFTHSNSSDYFFFMKIISIAPKYFFFEEKRGFLVSRQIIYLGFLPT